MPAAVCRPIPVRFTTDGHLDIRAVRARGSLAAGRPVFATGAARPRAARNPHLGREGRRLQLVDFALYHHGYSVDELVTMIEHVT